MLSNKNICLSLLFLTVSLLVKAQDNFRLVSRNSLDAKNSTADPLITGQGKTVGTIQYTMNGGEPEKYIVTKDNGENVLIDGLSYIRYAEQGNRFVTYGMPLYRHVSGSAFIRFYTGNGELIKETERVVDYPFATALSEQGDFYIVGCNYESQDGAITLIKFDEDGNKQWTRPLEGGMPSRISVSTDFQHIAVTLNSLGNNTSRTYYFTATGMEVRQDNRNFTIAATEFLSNGNIILASGNFWYLYDFSTDTALANGRCPSNVVGEYPITDDPDRQAFIINSRLVSGPDSAGIRLQAFDAADGTLLNEGEFYGDVYFTTHRLLNIKTDNAVELKLASDIYEINYTR